MGIIDAKDIVISAGKELVSRGLIARTWGNVSQRIDTNTMVITPSGRDYLSLGRDDIVEVAIDSLKWSGDVKPSSEKGAHANCYKVKDANFVIHTHQLSASVLSACSISSFDTDKDKYPLLSGKVIVADYGLPGTKKLSEGINRALNKAEGHAIIMRSHGALCYGKDFNEAFEAAKQLEDACMDYIKAEYISQSGAKEFSDKGYIDYLLSKYSVPAISYEPINFSLKIAASHIIINNSIEVLALSYIKSPLKPMVDDFAQIVGTKMTKVSCNNSAIEKALKKADAVFVEGYGAVCTGPTEDDAKAVSMIVEKNSKAFLGASLSGNPKPINPFECRLMRTVYKLKYSKQISK